MSLFGGLIVKTVWEEMCDQMAAHQGLIKHRIPLSEDKFTIAYIPQDLTRAEAERLTEWLRSMSVD